MIEVALGLWVGSEQALADLERPDDWYILHAAKEPWHREAVGYGSRAAPKDHPEYLFARRGNRLALNLVDTPDPAFVAPPLVEAALLFIEEGRALNVPVLVHCNQGRSRSATIALMHLAPMLGPDFEAAEWKMRRLYPDYAPAPGIQAFAAGNWSALYHNHALLSPVRAPEVATSGPPRAGQVAISDPLSRDAPDPPRL